MKITLLLLLSIFAFASCNSESGGSAETKIEQIKIKDGTYAYSNGTTIAAHFEVTGNGQNYKLGYLSIQESEYLVEIGSIEYNGSVATFYPTSYIPTNCGYATGPSGKGEWEFTQTTGYLTLQPTGTNSSSITFFLETYSGDMSSFFGGGIVSSCLL